MGIEEEQPFFGFFKAYPNPCYNSTKVSYYLFQKEKIEFEIYDLLGRKIYTENKGLQNKGNHEFDLDLEALNISPGTYLLRLKTLDKSSSIRLVKIKTSY